METTIRERKKISFTVDGVDYTLEYTPRSIRKMEADGFDFTKIESRIVNVGYDLFRGAFISRHPYVPVEERDRIYDLLLAENDDGESLIAALADMLKDELEWIMSKPQGNVKWAKV